MAPGGAQPAREDAALGALGAAALGAEGVAVAPRRRGPAPAAGAAGGAALLWAVASVPEVHAWSSPDGSVRYVANKDCGG